MSSHLPQFRQGVLTEAFPGFWVEHVEASETLLPPGRYPSEFRKTGRVTQKIGVEEEGERENHLRMAAASPSGASVLHNFPAQIQGLDTFCSRGSKIRAAELGGALRGPEVL